MDRESEVAHASDLFADRALSICSARFIHDSTCCDAPGLRIRDVLLGRASSAAVIDKQGESGCGALGRETPRRQDLEPSRDGRVMNNPGSDG